MQHVVLRKSKGLWKNFIEHLLCNYLDWTEAVWMMIFWFKIYKMFTGNLDAPVDTYPVFPGVEAHYLRAQIARISAGTQISPEGYFNLDVNEEDEEEIHLEAGEDVEARQDYEQNFEYEPLPVVQLALPSCKHWVHHTSYILPQGRVTW